MAPATSRGERNSSTDTKTNLLGRLRDGGRGRGGKESSHRRGPAAIYTSSPGDDVAPRLGQLRDDLEAGRRRVQLLAPAGLQARRVCRHESVSGMARGLGSLAAGNGILDRVLVQGQLTGQ